jgi:hypothetical protein
MVRMRVIQDGNVILEAEFSDPNSANVWLLTNTSITDPSSYQEIQENGQSILVYTI